MSKNEKNTGVEISDEVLAAAAAVLQMMNEGDVQATVIEHNGQNPSGADDRAIQEALDGTAALGYHTAYQYAVMMAKAKGRAMSYVIAAVVCPEKSGKHIWSENDDQGNPVKVGFYSDPVKGNPKSVRYECAPALGTTCLCPANDFYKTQRVVIAPNSKANGKLLVKALNAGTVEYLAKDVEIHEVNIPCIHTQAADWIVNDLPMNPTHKDVAKLDRVVRQEMNVRFAEFVKAFGYVPDVAFADTYEKARDSRLKAITGIAQKERLEREAKANAARVQAAADAKAQREAEAVKAARQAQRFTVRLGKAVKAFRS